MKLLKWSALGVLALVLLVAGGVALFVASFDANAYKPRLQALVQEKLHRTLAIDGDIGLKVFPKLGIALGKVTISERDAPQQVFARLDDAQLFLALWPLMSRAVVVDEVRISGLQATLIHHADGSNNFDDLRGQGAAGSPPGEPSQPSQALAFDVSGIRIEHSGLRWRNQATGEDTDLEIVHLQTGHLADHLATPVDLQLSVRDSKLATALELALKTTLSIDLGAQRYSLADIHAHLGGSAKGLTGIDATLTGRIDAEPDRPRVAVSALTLSAAATQGKLVLSKLELNVPSLAADLKDHVIEVDRLAASAEGKLASDAFKASLEAPKLAIDGTHASGETVHARLDLAGEQRALAARLDLAGVEGSAQAFSIGELGLDIDAHQGASAIKGKLSSKVSGSLADQVYRIPQLSGAFTVSAPGLPGRTTALPLELSALLDLKQGLLRADLSAGIEDSHLKARLEMSPLAAPHYDIDLNLDQLDVDRYLPPPPAAEARSTVAAPADTPVDLSALKALKLDARIAIGKLTVKHLQLAALHANISAAQGQVTLKPFSVQLYQGSLAGAASASAEGNRISLQQTLTGIAIGPLLKDLLGKAPLDGHGNVSLDIVTGGASVNAMKHALNGKAGLLLKDGAINGINLAESFRKAKGMLGGGSSSADQGAEAGQKTDFSELSANFVVHDGVAHNDDLSAKSPFLRLSGKGDVDIGNSKLDYLAQATLVANSSGQGGQDLGALRGIPVPVRASGPFSAPQFHLEFADLLRGAATAKVQQQFDQVKQQAGSRLQDALKDRVPGAAGGKKVDPAEALKGLFK